MGIEQRFSRSVFHFLRRSVDIEPEEGELASVDNGEEGTWGTRRASARFKGGKWGRLNGEPLAFEPTFYTVMDFEAMRQRSGKGEAGGG